LQDRFVPYLDASEAWDGVDPYRHKPVAVEWFEAWDGLLTGFRIRR